MDEKAEQKAAGAKRDEALVERLFRRMLDRVGAVVDRKLGRELETQTGFTTSRLIERMNRLIDERVREDPRHGRIAPHQLKLKIEWGTHSEAPPDTIKELEHEVQLRLAPGGRRLTVGRATDSDLPLTHASVSKIHAALLLNREGTLLVSDTGSTNGTYINGRRIAYGEARQIEEGDVVGFGDAEVRFRRT